MIDNGYTAQVIHCHPGAAGMTFTEFSHLRMETALEEWAASGLTTTAIRTELHRNFLASQTTAGVHIEMEPEPTVGGHTITAFIVRDRKRQPRRLMTQAERNEIAEWHREGFNYREIAEVVGRHPTTIFMHLRRVGLMGRAGA
ncbi:MAG: helix-turn-helix domain-containing protein [Acetobacter aceti]